MSKVFVTGTAGYIGTILTNKLLLRGDEVKGLDSLVFGGQHLIPNLYDSNFELVHSSLAAIGNKMVRDCDVVLHLGAIVFTHGDYMERQIMDVNLECTKKLVDLCKKERKHLVMISTCSSYGENGFATEESELYPTSAYARSKTDAEKYVNSVLPSATILRLSTVFGLSPRMRFDTTVNEFVRSAVSTGYLNVFNYDAWRPYIHIDDVTDALILFAHENIKGIYNIGDESLNVTKRILCDELQKQVPSLKIELQTTVNDPRNYRVCFDKVNEVGFKTRKTLADGIIEMKAALERKLFLNPYSDIYDNFKTYQKYYSTDV
jgi:nucleoside-diphosphate-sugar epimerase